MAKTPNKRKQNHKKSSLRRSFIGAQLEFNGNPDDYQVARYQNGRNFFHKDMADCLKFEFDWKIEISFQFRSGNFTRTSEHSFKASRARYNELSDYVSELNVKAGLEMPDGYVFEKEIWKARIVG